LEWGIEVTKPKGSSGKPGFCGILNPKSGYEAELLNIHENRAGKVMERLCVYYLVRSIVN
jgi:hypothetical protein